MGSSGQGLVRQHDTGCAVRNRLVAAALAAGWWPVAAALAAGLWPVAAQAQIFHLYLVCQGTVAAGLQTGATSPAPAAAPAPARDNTVLASRSAERFDDNTDKNSSDDNENVQVQVRARAVRSAAKRGDAHIELALRDNNMTAFVQRSNVLPMGERMRYVATQTHYTATYTPQPSSRAYLDWRGSWFFSWYPPFQKMAATRVAIDRQSGRLEGDVVGPAGEVLGLIDMQCEPRREGEGPAPKF